jgi:hypothetical protein
MIPSLNSRITVLKYRLAGFASKAAKIDLQKVEKSLRQANGQVASMELSHKKLLSSHQLGERFVSCHYVRSKELEILRHEVAFRQKALQRKVHLEQRWGSLNDEIRRQETSAKEAVQAEDMIESHTVHAAICVGNVMKATSSFVVSEAGVPGPSRGDDQSGSAGDMDQEKKLPVIAELVEGRVLARLERGEGDSLQIILITHSLKDQQLLNNFKRKYERIAEERGKRNASIRVERKKR